MHPLGISASISVFRFALALPFAGMFSVTLIILVFGYLFFIVDVAICNGVRCYSVIRYPSNVLEPQADAVLTSLTLLVDTVYI